MRIPKIFWTDKRIFRKYGPFYLRWDLEVDYWIVQCHGYVGFDYWWNRDKTNYFGLSNFSIKWELPGFCVSFIK